MVASWIAFAADKASRKAGSAAVSWATLAAGKIAAGSQLSDVSCQRTRFVEGFPSARILEAFDHARVLGDDKDPGIVAFWVDRKNEEAGPLGVEGLGSPDNLLAVVKRDFQGATVSGLDIVE